MKLEEGMYVRHNYFGIGKVINSYERDNRIWFNVKFNCYGDDDYHCGICEQSVGFKASHNIIKLIEVGDVLHCKYDNEYWTVQEHHGSEKWLQTEWTVIETMEEFYDTFDEIITKEQAKNISYKVK